MPASRNTVAGSIAAWRTMSPRFRQRIYDALIEVGYPGGIAAEILESAAAEPEAKANGHREFICPMGHGSRWANRAEECYPCDVCGRGFVPAVRP